MCLEDVCRHIPDVPVVDIMSGGVLGFRCVCGAVVSSLQKELNMSGMMEHGAKGHVADQPVSLTREYMKLVIELSSVDSFAVVVEQNAVKKGFRTLEPLPNKENTATFCINEVAEVVEFWEAFRTDSLTKPCDKAEKMKALGLPELTCAEEEVADLIIRALDRARAYKVDIPRALATKHLYNTTREELHGGKKA
jgi:hypothetical protein